MVRLGTGTCGEAPVKFAVMRSPLIVKLKSAEAQHE
jgi:hypothetical protein